MQDANTSGAYYTYTTSSGTTTSDTSAPAGVTIDTTHNNISEWKTSDTISSKAMGDKTYGTWYVQLGSDGKIVGYGCAE